MSLRVQAPCKINLILNILGRRPDGYHELETVIYPVALFDELQIEIAEHGIGFSCDNPGLPQGPSNLVVRAAQAFFDRTGIKAGVHIQLRKQIPIGAGLGGGSSDAAHTLLGLNKLFGKPLSAESLTELGASIGSDVPFFLGCRPALATGRGEQIKPLKPFNILEGLWLLLVYPGFGVSTAWAYRALQRYPAVLNGTAGRAEELIDLLYAGDLIAAMDHLYNSLEAPVLAKFPILRLYKEFLRAEGAMGTMMSGSGAAVFAFINDPDSAEQIRKQFVKKFGTTPWTYTVQARLPKTGHSGLHA